MGEGAIDHYAVLGLPSGEEGVKLSEKEISKAFKRKALELHPDKRAADAPNNAHANFQQLISSYEILKDEKSRMAFDNSLRVKREREHRLYESNSQRRRMEAELKEREQAAKRTSRPVGVRREINYWRELEVAIARNSACKRPSAGPFCKKETQRAVGEGVVEKEKILIVTWWEQHVDYTTDVLRTIFSEYGVAEDITIRDMEPGSMRRALVFMDSESAVAAAAAKGVCGDFRSPLHVFPLLPNRSTVQYSEAYEDYVLKKMQKAIDSCKL